MREFKSLPDYTPYADTGKVVYEHILAALDTQTIAKNRRAAFYAVGASEALLLDRLRAKWRPLYFEEKFYMEKYFALVPELRGE